MWRNNNDKSSSKGCGPHHVYCMMHLSLSSSVCLSSVCPSVHPPVRLSHPPSGESPCPLVLVQGSGFLWSVKTIVIVTNTSLEFAPKCTSAGGLSVNGSVFVPPVNMCLLRNWDIWSVSLEKWDETKLKPNSSFHITYMYCDNSVFPGQLDFLSPVDGCSGESSYGEATVSCAWVGM